MTKHWIWTVLLLLGISLGMTAWSILRTPRIAYVRSQDLVYGYFGMKEAMQEFGAKQARWKANIDTLSSDLDRNIREMQRPGLPPDERTAKQQVALKQRDELMRYSEAIEKKSNEDQKEMLNAVLGQINAFVENYAQERGFDIVLGTTDAGSLLYAQGGLDITEDLLTALNKEHQGIIR